MDLFQDYEDNDEEFYGFPLSDVLSNKKRVSKKMIAIHQIAESSAIPNADHLSEYELPSLEEDLANLASVSQGNKRKITPKHPGKDFESSASSLIDIMINKSAAAPYRGDSKECPLAIQQQASMASVKQSPKMLTKYKAGPKSKTKFAHLANSVSEVIDKVPTSTFPISSCLESKTSGGTKNKTSPSAIVEKSSSLSLREEAGRKVLVIKTLHHNKKSCDTQSSKLRQSNLVADRVCKKQKMSASQSVYKQQSKNSAHQAREQQSSSASPSVSVHQPIDATNRISQKPRTNTLPRESSDQQPGNSAHKVNKRRNSCTSQSGSNSKNDVSHNASTQNRKLSSVEVAPSVPDMEEDVTAFDISGTFNDSYTLPDIAGDGDVGGLDAQEDLGCLGVNSSVEPLKTCDKTNPSALAETVISDTEHTKQGKMSVLTSSGNISTGLDCNSSALPNSFSSSPVLENDSDISNGEQLKACRQSSTAEACFAAADDPTQQQDVCKSSNDSLFALKDRDAVVDISNGEQLKACRQSSTAEACLAAADDPTQQQDVCKRSNDSLLALKDRDAVVDISNGEQLKACRQSSTAEACLAAADDPTQQQDVCKRSNDSLLALKDRDAVVDISNGEQLKACRQSSTAEACLAAADDPTQQQDVCKRSNDSLLALKDRDAVVDISNGEQLKACRQSSTAEACLAAADDPTQQQDVCKRSNDSLLALKDRDAVVEKICDKTHRAATSGKRQDNRTRRIQSCDVGKDLLKNIANSENLLRIDGEKGDQLCTKNSDELLKSIALKDVDTSVVKDNILQTFLGSKIEHLINKGECKVKEISHARPAIESSCSTPDLALHLDISDSELPEYGNEFVTEAFEPSFDFNASQVNEQQHRDFDVREGADSKLHDTKSRKQDAARSDMCNHRSEAPKKNKVSSLSAKATCRDVSQIDEIQTQSAKSELNESSVSGSDDADKTQPFGDPCNGICIENKSDEGSVEDQAGYLIHQKEKKESINKEKNKKQWCSDSSSGKLITSKQTLSRSVSITTNYENLDVKDRSEDLSQIGGNARPTSKAQNLSSCGVISYIDPIDVSKQKKGSQDDSKKTQNIYETPGKPKDYSKRAQHRDRAAKKLTDYSEQAKSKDERVGKFQDDPKKIRSKDDSKKSQNKDVEHRKSQDDSKKGQNKYQELRKSRYENKKSPNKDEVQGKSSDDPKKAQNKDKETRKTRADSREARNKDDVLRKSRDDSKEKQKKDDGRRKSRDDSKKTQNKNEMHRKSRGDCKNERNKCEVLINSNDDSKKSQNKDVSRMSQYDSNGTQNLDEASGKSQDLKEFQDEDHALENSDRCSVETARTDHAMVEVGCMLPDFTPGEKISQKDEEIKKKFGISDQHKSSNTGSLTHLSSKKKQLRVTPISLDLNDVIPKLTRSQLKRIKENDPVLEVQCYNNMLNKSAATSDEPESILTKRHHNLCKESPQVSRFLKDSQDMINSDLTRKRSTQPQTQSDVNVFDRRSSVNATEESLSLARKSTAESSSKTNDTELRPDVSCVNLPEEQIRNTRHSRSTSLDLRCKKLSDDLPAVVKDCLGLASSETSSTLQPANASNESNIARPRCVKDSIAAKSIADCLGDITRTRSESPLSHKQKKCKYRKSQNKYNKSNFDSYLKAKFGIVDVSDDASLKAEKVETPSRGRLNNDVSLMGDKKMSVVLEKLDIAGYDSAGNVVLNTTRGSYSSSPMRISSSGPPSPQLNSSRNSIINSSNSTPRKLVRVNPGTRDDESNSLLKISNNETKGSKTSGPGLRKTKKISAPQVLNLSPIKSAKSSNDFAFENPMLLHQRLDIEKQKSDLEIQRLILEMKMKDLEKERMELEQMKKTLHNDNAEEMSEQQQCSDDAASTDECDQITTGIISKKRRMNSRSKEESNPKKRFQQARNEFNLNKYNSNQLGSNPPKHSRKTRKPVRSTFKPPQEVNHVWKDAIVLKMKQAKLMQPPVKPIEPPKENLTLLLKYPYATGRGGRRRRRKEGYNIYNFIGLSESMRYRMNLVNRAKHLVEPTESSEKIKLSSILLTSATSFSKPSSVCYSELTVSNVIDINAPPARNAADVNGIPASLIRTAANVIDIPASPARNEGNGNVIPASHLIATSNVKNILATLNKTKAHGNGLLASRSRSAASMIDIITSQARGATNVKAVPASRGRSVTNVESIPASHTISAAVAEGISTVHGIEYVRGRGNDKERVNVGLTTNFQAPNAPCHPRMSELTPVTHVADHSLAHEQSYADHLVSNPQSTKRRINDDVDRIAKRPKLPVKKNVRGPQGMAIRKDTAHAASFSVANDGEAGSRSHVSVPQSVDSAMNYEVSCLNNPSSETNTVSAIASKDAGSTDDSVGNSNSLEMDDDNFDDDQIFNCSVLDVDDIPACDLDKVVEDVQVLKPPHTEESANTDSTSTLRSTSVNRPSSPYPTNNGLKHVNRVPETTNPRNTERPTGSVNNKAIERKELDEIHGETGVDFSNEDALFWNSTSPKVHRKAENSKLVYNPYQSRVQYPKPSEPSNLNYVKKTLQKINGSTRGRGKNRKARVDKLVERVKDYLVRRNINGLEGCLVPDEFNPQDVKRKSSRWTLNSRISSLGSSFPTGGKNSESSRYADRSGVQGQQLGNSSSLRNVFKSTVDSIKLGTSSKQPYAFAPSSAKDNQMSPHVSGLTNPQISVDQNDQMKASVSMEMDDDDVHISAAKYSELEYSGSQRVHDVLTSEERLKMQEEVQQAIPLLDSLKEEVLAQRNGTKLTSENYGELVSEEIVFCHSASLPAHVFEDSTGKQTYHCPYCKYSTQIKYKYKYHFARHDWQGITCEECGQKCQDKDALDVHKRMHATNKDVMYCHDCDFSTSFRENMEEHVHMHLRVQEGGIEGYLATKGSSEVIPCPFCSYSTIHKHNMKDHIRTHTRTDMYKCPECDYKTIKKFNLLKHLGMHDESLRLSCPYCSFTTPYEKYMKLHIVKHTGEGMLYCDECSYYTHRKDLLTKHKMMHSGDNLFRCTECDYVTAWKKNFQTHQLSHVTRPTINCEHCPFKSANRFKMKSHLRQHGYSMIQAKEKLKNYYKTWSSSFKTGLDQVLTVMQDGELNDRTEQSTVAGSADGVPDDYGFDDVDDKSLATTTEQREANGQVCEAIPEEDEVNDPCDKRLQKKADDVVDDCCLADLDGNEKNRESLPVQNEVNELCDERQKESENDVTEDCELDDLFDIAGTDEHTDENAKVCESITEEEFKEPCDEGLRELMRKGDA